METDNVMETNKKKRGRKKTINSSIRKLKARLSNEDKLKLLGKITSGEL